MKREIPLPELTSVQQKILSELVSNWSFVRSGSIPLSWVEDENALVVWETPASHT